MAAKPGICFFAPGMGFPHDLFRTTFVFSLSHYDLPIPMRFHYPATLRFGDSSTYASNFIPTWRDSFSASLTIFLHNHASDKKSPDRKIRSCVFAVQKSCKAPAFSVGHLGPAQMSRCACGLGSGRSAPR